jgi:hypothetical protein
MTMDTSMTTTSSVESGLAAWIQAARAAENHQGTKDFDPFSEALSEIEPQAEACVPERILSPPVNVSGQDGVQEEYKRAVLGIGESLRAFGVDPSTLTFERESLLCWNPNGFVLENTIWATAASGDRIGFRAEWAARTPEVSAAEICSQLLGVSTAPGAYQPLLDGAG